MESRCLQEERLSPGENVCLICLKIYTVNKPQTTDNSTLTHFQNIFDKVSKHFSATAEIFGSCFQWNFVKEGSSPICPSCIASVEKIYQINSRLEKLQSVIEDLINAFTCEVLSCRQKLEQLCPTAKCSIGKHTEDIKSEDIDVKDIKEECFLSDQEDDDCVGSTSTGGKVTDSEDITDIKVECFLSDQEEDAECAGSTDGIDNEVQDIIESSHTTIITRKDPVKISNLAARRSFGTEKRNPTSDVAIQYPHIPLKHLSIVLTRLDLPKNSPRKVVTIPAEGLRPKRKAALTANADSKKQYIAEGPKQKIPKTNIKRSNGSRGKGDWKTHSEKEESDSLGSGDDDEETNSINKCKPISKSNILSRGRPYEVAKRFKCQIASCNWGFNFSKELESHSLESGHKNDKEYKCLKCPKTFYRRFDLKVHKKAHRTKISIKCQDCPKTFRFVKLLRIHHCRYHKTRFKCEFCEKSFFRKFNLKQHTKIHYGIIYKCKDCPKNFKCKISLKQHKDFEHNMKKFQCKQCGKVFRKRLNLTQHYSRHLKSKIRKVFPCAACHRTHFIERIWDNCIIKHFRKRNQKGAICAICAVTFKNTKELDDHSVEKKHINKKLFKCIICKKRYYKRVDLKNHKKIHRSKPSRAPNSMECHICLKKFRNKSCMKNHLEWHTNPAKVCKTCGKQYKDIRDLEDHENTHTGNEKYKCKTCGDKFLKRFLLRYHNKTCRKISGISFDCSFCVEVFDTEAKLKKHKRVHKGYIVNFPCKFCGKVYNRRRAAAYHMRQHLSTDLYTCTESECVKAFDSKSKLKIHLLSHSEERPFPCTVCEMKFKRQHQLNGHLARHAKVRVICEICGKDFSGKDELRTHKRLHNETLFPCPSCDRKFYSNYALREHIKVVHDQIAVERKKVLFPCEVCHKSFTEKRNLNSHLRRHTGEKPYSCEKCNKSFVTKDALAKHVNIHAEKNIKCGNCFKSFAGKELLNKHVKRVHGNKNFQCEFCPYSCRQNAHLITNIRTQHTAEAFRM